MSPAPQTCRLYKEWCTTRDGQGPCAPVPPPGSGALPLQTAHESSAGALADRPMPRSVLIHLRTNRHAFLPRSGTPTAGLPAKALAHVPAPRSTSPRPPGSKLQGSGTHLFFFGGGGGVVVASCLNGPGSRPT